MNRVEDSSLLQASTAEIAKMIFDEGILGGPDENSCEDPVMLQLWAPVQYYSMGNCLPLALALMKETGGKLCIHEVRLSQSSDWDLRHAFVGLEGCPQEGAYSLDGMNACQILDALGGGKMADRGELFAIRGEHRVVVMDAETALTRFTDFSGAEGLDDAKHLPGVAAAMGWSFDLREAISWFLSKDEFSAELDEESARELREWCGLHREALPVV